MGRALLLAALDVLGASPASRLGPTGKREVALQRLRGSVSALVRNQARKAEEVAKRRASRLGGSDDDDDEGDEEDEEGGGEEEGVSAIGTGRDDN